MSSLAAVGVGPAVSLWGQNELLTANPFKDPKNPFERFFHRSDVGGQTRVTDYLK